MPESPTPARGKVLLVEDDPAARSVLEALLDEEFSVVTAGSVHDARLLLGSREFDTMVTDYELPDGDGGQLVAGALTRPGMTAIVLTGHADYPEVRQIQEEGRVLVLFKPIDPDSLLAWVRNHVGLSRLARATDGLRRRGVMRRRGGLI